MYGEDYIVMREADGDGFASDPGLARPADVGKDVDGRSFVIETHEDPDPADLAELRSDPSVRAIAPDFPLTLHKPVAKDIDAPNETELRLGRTWGLDAIGIGGSPEWSGKGATVAVLDTGIQDDHPAFAHMSQDRIVAKNFTSEAPQDLDGHGTHCAGTIFGQEVDGIRIGVAPNIERALIAKVIGRDGGSTKTLVDAIDWVFDNEANVVSMSLGFDFTRYVRKLSARFPDEVDEEARLRSATSQALEAYLSTVRIFDTLIAQKLALAPDTAPLFVAATGNDSLRDQRAPAIIGASPPAVASNVLAVGAVGEGGRGGYGLAPFSNAGADVVAPGVCVLSAVPGGELDSKNGTSMATPHIAGLAALWFEFETAQNQMCSAADLLANLKVSASTSPLADRERDDVGRGLPTAPGPRE